MKCTHNTCYTSSTKWIELCRTLLTHCLCNNYSEWTVDNLILSMQCSWDINLHCNRVCTQYQMNNSIEYVFSILRIQKKNVWKFSSFVKYWRSTHCTEHITPKKTIRSVCLTFSSVIKRLLYLGAMEYLNNEKKTRQVCQLFTIYVNEENFEQIL